MMGETACRKFSKSGATVNFASNGKQKLEQGENPSCAFCRRNEDCPEKYGEKKTYNGITLHYYCLIMSSGLYQRGEENEGIYGFLAADIKKEIKRASRIRCRVCRKCGASIGCAVAKCPRSYHFPCGVEKQCIFQFTGEFASYCWDHRPQQKVPAIWSGSTYTCAICLESIDPNPSYEVLKSPCCKNTWFHRQCVQYQSLSAGMFFFKCTICNNKDEFQKEMLRMGIHVPEKDASWELEENAFQELLQRYQRCDARRCLCKNGREYVEPDSKWDIVLCKYCGSSGTHLACSFLAICMENWECPDCRHIVYKSGRPELYTVLQKRTPQHPEKPQHDVPTPVLKDKLRKRLNKKRKSPKRKLADNQGSRHSPSKCCKLSSEARKECKNCQIFTSKSHTDILKDLRSQIKLNVISRISVDRTNVWEGALREMRRKTFSPSSTICIQFSNDARKSQVAIDLGNPCYEFFCLLMHHLANSLLFEGSATSKNMTLNSRALRCDWYYEAGRMIAISLVHGGPSPNFFSRTLFSCLAYGPEVTEPNMGDVSHVDVTRKIKKIQESSTLEELKLAVKENTDYLSVAGCLRSVWSLDDKEMLLKDMLTFHVISRVRSPFERFREGLKVLGVLENIQKYPEVFAELLCYKPVKLTAETFEKLFSINFSPNGSNRRIAESRVFDFWRDYLADMEDGTTEAAFEDILTFVTGTNIIPAICFLPDPSIKFLHSDGIIQYRFPTAQTCLNCLKLPMSKTYEEFKGCMDFAICNTPGLK
ncbi:G2/M phase-specific E3 ubiquitin-protein ligase isoform X1 [Hemiscyllium ocellatum]|uniref:G2/M phase-specific E3 ubiquitin-protein ligase isoform X1 n=1 Tax=Hemiscyllium ocellatum TaxID=170820 RepID=UPI002966747E|nr:G2/M phase-specific E3 ubiquitin-protein ligase isoform X1 [Hemiscyllium ocellatum]